MEAKLKEYRALRRRRELVQSTKNKLENTKKKVTNFFISKILGNMDKERKEDEVVLIEDEEIPEANLPQVPVDLPIETASEVSEQESYEVEKQESWRYFIIKWSIYGLSWLTLYIFFLQLQFGAVFFAVSVLIGIYLNTRTRPKKKGEVSAYSVFNDNCVSIDGTLKAEQFEREIRYGAGTVRAL